MPRRKPVTEDANKKIKDTVLLNYSGVIGDTIDLNFLNGTIVYMSKKLYKSFSSACIDNIGEGNIRFSLNYLNLDISTPIDGTKTLLPGDTLSISGVIEKLSIYFIGDSTVELILVK